MSVRKQLHILLRGVEQLRVPGRGSEERFDAYCLVSAGRQQHRSRVIEHTAAPEWNEEFVFDGSSIAPDEVVKLEVFSQGLLQDELLCYSYLELACCASLDNDNSSSCGQPDAQLCATIHEDEEEQQQHHGTTAAAAGVGPLQQQVPAVVARVSEVTTQRLALLSATGSASLSGFSSRSSSGSSGSSRSGKSLSKMRLKRSTHVRSATDLVVCVWWVLQPVMDDTGVQPCVLSFVQRRGCPHSLPSATHLDAASLWEEPCLAFVRLVVSKVCLGPAAAGAGVVAVGSAAGAAVAAAAAAGGGSASQQAPVDGSSSSGGGGGGGGRAVSTRKSNKAVLRRLTGLLRGDAAAAEEVAAAAAALSSDDEAASSALDTQLERRPTLLDIHNAGGLAQSFRAGGGGGAAGLTHWDFQALDELFLDDEEDEAEADAEAGQGSAAVAAATTSTSSSDAQHPHALATSGSGGASGGGVAGILRRSSSGGGGAAAADGDHSSSGGGGGQHKKPPKASSTTSSSRSRRRATTSSSSSDDKEAGGHKKLHLLVKVQLGSQEVQALKPVPLKLDGSADVSQAAVFAVLRPLDEATITYSLGLCRGANSPPLLVLVFQYSLLHLLRRSPPHSYVWEDWRRIARATVPGLQVPLPVLPLAFLDLSAFLADADCRAGMFQVPPVSAAALAAAAADDAAAAAAAAAEAEAAAAAAVQAAAAADSDASLTDSEDLSAADDEQQQQPGVAYDFVAPDKGSAGARQQGSAAAGFGVGAGVSPGVLRRRPAPGSAAAAAEEAAAAAAAGGGSSSSQQQQQQQQQPSHGGKASRRPQLEKWRSRMMHGVEAGLNQAMDRLPDNVAQKVQGNRFISRVFPRAQRSEVFAIGQLRVLSSKNPAAAAAAAAAAASGGHASDPSSSTAHAQPSSTLQQQQQQPRAASVSGGGPRRTVSRNISAGLLSAKSSAEQAAALAAAAAAAAKQAAQVVPLQKHPNVATAGHPAAGPLGVLQLTLQAIALRKGSLSSGYSLLLKCGPHWLQASPAALPLHIYTSSSSSIAMGGSSGSEGWAVGGGSSRCEAQQAPPLQVLIPVYGSSCLVALVLHRRGSVVGRCVFRLHGLLPLLLREYRKSLVLYSDKRGAGGGRIIAGSVLLKLSAAPSPGSSRLGTISRLACAYLVTPHTLSLHTSGVLETMGRDQRAAAAGRVVAEWLGGAQQGVQQAAVVPEPLVRQLVSTGRTALSSRSMKGHVRRIKAVLLDQLPRRLDPLGFYFWRRPLHNLLALWVLSHACLHPGQWLLSVSLLVTLLMLRLMAIQVRSGVLGFEMEQVLPPELGASPSTDLQQQQQGNAGELSEWGSGDASGGAGGSTEHHQLLGERLKYKEAAEKLREKIAAGKNKLMHGSELPHSPSPSTAAAAAGAAEMPTSLAELREQLEAGTLNLDALDIEAAAQQLLSVGGVLKLARKHSGYLLEYALVAQNLLDDAAGFAEGLFAMATAQDPLAALLLCAVLLGASSFCYVFGLGAGVWVLIVVLLRPPLLRGVPGVFGWKAILSQLRGHGRSLEELAW